MVLKIDGDAGEYWPQNILHQHQPSTSLTIADAVELAKAGIKVELSGPVQIVSAPFQPAPPPSNRVGSDIGAAIIDRLIQNKRAGQSPRKLAMEGMSYFNPPDITAYQHDGKVYVFVYVFGMPPEVMEDDALIYPSDALLARINLLIAHAGKTG